MQKSSEINMPQRLEMPYWLSLIVVSLFASCRTPTHTPYPSLAIYFQSMPLKDTLHIEISVENTAGAGDTIPNQVFFTSIPSVLLQQIDHLADSAQAIVIGRQKIPLDDNTLAYWVDIRQFWFQHHSLFLYNKSKKAFTDRITVAEWYGGDGGQVLLGSWIFDYNGDGKKDIVLREIQHSLIPTDEEPLEQVFEFASLLLWKNGQFEDTPFQDTAIMIRRFPIRSFW